MGGLGVAIGTVLVIASKAFYVYEDPQVVAIDDVLPGANCGGCGFPGCTANAEAIVKGEQDVNSCVAAGEDVANAIAAIMGVSVSDKEPEFAGAGCFYGTEDADLNYIYKGIKDCRAAAMLLGGMKVCRIGCLGLGTCVTACKFGALRIGENGLPEVDQTKCTGCGACEKICPKNIIRLTSTTRRIMREYTLEECVTPCQQACPSGLDIKEYVRLIKEGDYAASLQVIKERMPFPTVISRICPALCEFDCRRTLQDESVGINDLKRFVVDWERGLEERIQPYKAPGTDKKIAVIGGGVEGLSAAYFTARLGHAPTVFEATEHFGGILRKAISRDRLKMEELEWDVQGISDLGVELKNQAVAGVDFTIPGLMKEGFDAVFTATGGWDSRLMREEADKIIQVFPGAYLLIDLLRSAQNSALDIKAGERVVIAGDGVNLPQAVERLKDMGALEIVVVSRKDSLEQAEAAISAGADLMLNSGIVRILGEDENLTQVEVVDLATGEARLIDADTLFIGAGRFPELVFTPQRPEEEEMIIDLTAPLAWEAVEFFKKVETESELGLLSGQNMISEYPSAVSAINGGRKAAAAIHNRMYGIEYQDNINVIKDASCLQGVDEIHDVENIPRQRFEIADGPSDLKDSFSTGLTVEGAKAEADRCLKCGLVCYQRKADTTQLS
ncbi:MAG: RnfABCDGE type electron transport complex subunit B [Desulfobacterales bacterium]|nr:RnfABCDGE type electron transport complex subunit B [Desulfobacterales bacterium]